MKWVRVQKFGIFNFYNMESWPLFCRGQEEKSENDKNIEIQVMRNSSNIQDLILIVHILNREYLRSCYIPLNHRPSLNGYVISLSWLPWKRRERFHLVVQVSSATVLSMELSTPAYGKRSWGRRGALKTGDCKLASPGGDVSTSSSKL